MSVSDKFKNTTKKIKQQNIKLSICDGELTVKEIHMMPVHIFNALPIWKLRKQKEVIAKELKYSFEGQLFKTIMKQVEITVKNANEIKDKDINFKYGLFVNDKFEYVDLGNYFIKDIEDNKKKDEITVIGYDRMIRFMKTFKQSELQLTYPCKMLELVQKMCEVCGVELYSTDFYNANLDIKEDFFTVQELTYRDVLEKVAQTTLTTAFIEDNKLNLYKINDETIEKIDKSYLTDLTIKEKFGPVNVLVLGRGDVEDNVEEINEESIEQNGRCEIRFDENEFVEYQREKVISGMFEQIKGLEYYSFEASDVGVMWLKPCTCIELGDKEDNLYKSYYLKANITINTGISSDIEAELPEETNTEYKVTTKEEKKTLKVERLAKKNEGIIQDLIEETTEQSSKLTKVEQTVDSIAQKVEDIEDLTQTTEGIKTITLENCVEGDLIELHIYGNNTVFNYLYPQNDLYPNDDLYPKGDSRIIVSNFNSGSEENNWHKIYELGIADVLRQNGSVYDEYILKDGKAQIIRRINKDGTIKNNEEIEDLGVFQINLGEETNVIEIQNYSARLSAKFAIKSDYTDIFATKVEMNSSITQTAEEINLEVKKKVDENEVISKINQSAEEVQINANKISLDGKQIDLTTGKISIISDSLNIDKSGRMILKGIPEETETQPAIKIMNPQNDDMYVDISSGALLGHGQHVYRTQFYYNMGFLGLNNVDGSGTIHTPSYSVYRDSLGNDNIELDGITGDIKCIKLTQTSKESKKKNITKYNEKALNIVKDSEIYTYNFKSEDNKNRKHIGFVIGDAGGNYKTPEQVISNDREGIDNYSMTSILWKAFQEYVSEKDEQIEQLQNKIKELEEKING